MENTTQIREHLGPTDDEQHNDFKPIKFYAEAAYESLLIPPPAVHTPFWPVLDRLLGGFRPNEYTILCGSTGSGKTAYLSSLIEQVASQGDPCAIASVENGPVDFYRRALSSRAKRNLNTGEVVPLHRVQIFRRDNPDFDSLPIYVSTYEDRVDNYRVMDQVRKLVEQRGVKLVVLDNFNFFTEVKKSSDQNIEIDRVIHDWIIFCKQTPVHVIMIMHPRKGDTKNNNRVTSEFDVKGSATSVQESHNVLLFNRLSQDLVTDENREYLSHFRELTIAKCRRRGMSTGQAVVFHSPDGSIFTERSPNL